MYHPATKTAGIYGCTFPNVICILWWISEMHLWWRSLENILTPVTVYSWLKSAFISHFGWRL